MKDKILQRLKVKFPGVNLSKVRMDAIADKLKLEDSADDAAIDARLDELNDIFPFVEIAKQDDRVRTLDAKPKPADPAKPDSPAPSDDPAKPEDVPPWAKGLTTQIQTLTTELSTLKAEKSTNSRKTALEEKLKDAPQAIKDKILKDFGRMSFADETAFNEFLTETETDLPALIQTSADQGLKSTSKPIVPAGGDKNKASKEEVASVVNNIT